MQHPDGPDRVHGPHRSDGPDRGDGPDRAALRAHVPTMVRSDVVPSTQDIAAALLEQGQQPPFAVTAVEQTAGRGRLQRPFRSPRGSSLALTLACRTTLSPATRSWLPLLVGVAAHAALIAELPALTGRVGLKWPNDLHTAEGGKLGGILVEGRGEDLVLMGIGVNLRGPILDSDGSPLPGAAWLVGTGGMLAADEVTAGQELTAGLEPTAGQEPAADGKPEVALELAQLRRRLEETIAGAIVESLCRLEAADGDAEACGLTERYTMICLTVGRSVRIDPLGTATAASHHGAPSPLHGIARGVDRIGRLLVEGEDGVTAVALGDVQHLRALPPPGTISDHPHPSHHQEDHGT